MRTKELAKLLANVPGDPEVIIEIFDETDQLLGDSSWSIDEVSIGPFCILRSVEVSNHTTPITVGEES